MVLIRRARVCALTTQTSGVRRERGQDMVDTTRRFHNHGRSVSRETAHACACGVSRKPLHGQEPAAVRDSRDIEASVKGSRHQHGQHHRLPRAPGARATGARRESRPRPANTLGEVVLTHAKRELWAQGRSLPTFRKTADRNLPLKPSGTAPLLTYDHRSLFHVKRRRRNFRKTRR
jgi:hypothetical protein